MDRSLYETRSLRPAIPRTVWALGVIEGLVKLTKPLFPFAHSVETVFTVRYLDCFVRRIRAARFTAGRRGSHQHHRCHRGAYSLSRRLRVRPPHLAISQGGFF